MKSGKPGVRMNIGLGSLDGLPPESLARYSWKSGDSMNRPCLKKDSAGAS